LAGRRRDCGDHAPAAGGAHGRAVVRRKNQGDLRKPNPHTLPPSDEAKEDFAFALSLNHTESLSQEQNEEKREEPDAFAKPGFNRNANADQIEKKAQ